MNRAVLFISMVMATAASGQTLLLKDGKKVVAKALRRSGDTITATAPSVNGAAALQGEAGYPLSQIDKIEFPEPAVLKSAAGLLLSGKAAEALSQSESAFTYFAGFRDAPGSYWSDLALLRISALAALSRDAEAEPLARQIISQASSPDTIRGAKVQLAGFAGRRGEHAEAIEICDQILREGSTSETMASAAMNKARSHQALKQWDSALLAYLNIPVFYPEQKAHVPTYLLGSGQCYFELSDLPRAKESFNALVTSFPSVGEAETAKTELDKIARREKALETVK
ncbi:MAG TPA: tetratricopeptide repeat protein [Chthoniobacteraceae bacterium]|nr:tetratricopeptide repeat protein [Chthoniobacteraceae bacterium]